MPREKDRVKIPEKSLLHILGFNVQGDLGPITCYQNRNNRLVWYLRAPPQKPPTAEQITQREKFRLAASLWRELTPLQKSHWNTAAQRGHLRISGYNLFTFLIATEDWAIIDTLQHQTGTPLIN
jgi:hypothetical protein